jgi:hypothetical protein
MKERSEPMVFQAAFLIAALVCFIVAAVKAGKLHWGWTGMAILVVYVLVVKGKLV